MKLVFVDSGGFFAHLVAEDSLHARAKELFAQAQREGTHDSVGALLWQERVNGS